MSKRPHLEQLKQVTLPPLPKAATAPELSEAERAVAKAREREVEADKAVQVALREQAAAIAGTRAAIAAAEADRAVQHAVEQADLASRAGKGTQLPSRFLVVEGGSFSMGGHMCSVKKGQEVLLQAYGLDGLDRMRKRGIVLEPLQ